MTNDVNKRKAFESSNESAMDDDDLFEDIVPESKPSKTSFEDDTDEDEFEDLVEYEYEDEDDSDSEDLYEEELEDEEDEEELVPESEKKKEEGKDSDSARKQAEEDTRENRRIRQLVEEKNKAAERLAELERENARLKKQSKSSDRQYAEDKREAVQQLISNLEERLTQAISSGDVGEQVKITSALQKANIDERALNTYLSQYDDGDDGEDAAETTSQNQNTQRAVVDREDLIDRLPAKARNWAIKNTWFGTNTQLTNATIMIGNDLAKEGFDSNEDEYFEELDARLREQFPRRFKSDSDEKESAQETAKRDERPKSLPKVGSSSKTTIRRSRDGKKRLPRLSEEEKVIADNLGVSHKEYAKQKALLDNAKDGYLVVMDD